MKNIVLIGFMGSGKTSVAKSINRASRIKYVDTDNLIIEEEQMQINEIFEEYGEEYFRIKEKQMSKKLRKVQNIVIATGGGFVMNDNIKNLNDNSVVYYLYTSFDVMVKRLQNSKNRPLFKNDDSLKKLYDTRRVLYEQNSDHVIDTDNRTVDEVAKEILRLHLEE